MRSQTFSAEMVRQPTYDETRRRRPDTPNSSARSGIRRDSGVFDDLGSPKGAVENSSMNHSSDGGDVVRDRRE